MEDYSSPSANQLFSDLKKFRPREGKDSVENFITASFCWVLKNNQRFSSYFLDKICSKLNLVISCQKGEWETQVNFGGKFPDMVYKYANGTKILVFEHKAWAHLHENQLSNYRNFTLNQYNSSHIILITANSSQHTQNPDLALCWSDIYIWIDEWAKDNTSDFILGSFQNLLKHEGLGPHKAITPGAILYYFTVGDFVERLRQLVSRCLQRGTILKYIRSEELIMEKEEDWGRLGIGNKNSDDWKPAIFVGFMLDGKDHSLKPILESSPDFVIILSFGKKFHKDYHKNENYLNLVEELEKEIPLLEGEWQFYHHIKDKGITEHNYWHPLYVRKPMLELFRGTVTHIDQDNELDKAIELIVPILWRSEHTQKLKEDLKKY